MGSQESKIEQPPNQEEEQKESIPNDSAPTTPILTPKDPRSPSVNIARTPLDIILGVQTIEGTPDVTKHDVEESKEVVNVVLGIDPRSPTVEFNRTPIIVETIPKGKLSKIQNKNLDNVRKSEVQTTPVAAGRKLNIVPPKLLSTSPVSVVTNYNKRKSFVGLLETNIDFTETNLDTVCQAKANLNTSLPLEIPDTPSNKLKSQMETLQINKDVELTPVNHSEDEMEKTDEKEVNVTAQVKDFDKKLTNLIYQDDSDDDIKPSRAVKVKENNRTPLGVRNSNEDNKKTASRLKVSDKPRKSEISKIPVFKDNHNRRIGIQCENTPPSMKMNETKRAKISQWDADKTLII